MCYFLLNFLIQLPLSPEPGPGVGWAGRQAPTVRIRLPGTACIWTCPDFGRTCPARQKNRRIHSGGREQVTSVACFVDIDSRYNVSCSRGFQRAFLYHFNVAMLRSNQSFRFFIYPGSNFNACLARFITEMFFL